MEKLDQISVSLEVQVKRATMKRHKILNGGTQEMQNSNGREWSKLFSLLMQNSFTLFSINFLFRLFSHQFNGNLFQQWRMPSNSQMELLKIYTLTSCYTILN